LEEQDGGLYRLLEKVAEQEADTLLEKLQSASEVPILPHNERADVLDATRRAVARAGYEFKEVRE
jgi:hypothetical protein